MDDNMEAMVYGGLGSTIKVEGISLHDDGRLICTLCVGGREFPLIEQSTGDWRKGTLTYRLNFHHSDEVLTVMKERHGACYYALVYSDQNEDVFWIEGKGHGRFCDDDGRRYKEALLNELDEDGKIVATYRIGFVRV